MNLRIVLLLAVLLMPQMALALVAEAKPGCHYTCGRVFRPDFLTLLILVTCFVTTSLFIKSLIFKLKGFAWRDAIKINATIIRYSFPLSFLYSAVIIVIVRYTVAKPFIDGSINRMIRIPLLDVFFTFGGPDRLDPKDLLIRIFYTLAIIFIITFFMFVQKLERKNSFRITNLSPEFIAIARTANIWACVGVITVGIFLEYFLKLSRSIIE